MSRVSDSQRRVDGFNAAPGREVRRLLRSSKGERLFDQALTDLCVVDFWTFVKYGIYFEALVHYYERLHSRLSGFLVDWVDEGGDPVLLKFLVTAREHCKTQLGMAWVVWELVRNQELRFLMRSHKDPAIFAILAGIKDILLSPCFRYRFPWVKPAMKGNREVKWSESSILIERKLSGVRTNTIEAFGVNSDATGHHFERGLYDDWETEASANSDDLCEELFSKFALDNNLMVGGGRRLVIGTPYNKNAFIMSAVDGKGVFADQTYSLFLQPCTDEIYPGGFSGQEPILLEDRLTFRCGDAGFPTEMGNLEGCQARVLFFSPVVKDTTEEIREVVWNDTRSFRVNRKIPALLGQPLTWEIGGERPAAPNRFTLDAIDEIDADTETIDRKSLVRTRNEQGSFTFSCQMKLNPVDPESLVFNPADIQEIDEADLPDGDVRNFRACDFATAKKTDASTAIVTGFHHASGVYLTHIAYGNRMTGMDILLELFLGALREQEKGRPIETTFFERASIENTLAEFLRQAERGPYEFFKARGGIYATAAEKFLVGMQSFYISKRELSRGGYMSKNLRIKAVQPLIEAGKLFIVKGIRHIDKFWEEIESFTLTSNGTFDILDCMRDLAIEGRMPVSAQAPLKKPGMYNRIMRDARGRNRFRDFASHRGAA